MKQAQTEVVDSVTRPQVTNYKRAMYMLLLEMKPEQMTDGDADLMATLAADEDLQRLLEFGQW